MKLNKYVQYQKKYYSDKFIMVQYKFITDDPTKFGYNPEKRLHSFYQICKVHDPITGKFMIRKVIFDQLGEIIKTFIKAYPKHKIINFIKNHKPHQYAMYPVNNVSLVGLPNADNILSAQSELLNDNF